MSDQQDSVETFLASIGSVPSDAPTACTDWTAHNIAAHLAAGFEEVYVLIQNTLTGQPTRDTRSFDEREAPYLEMDHETLLQSLREHLTTTAKVLAEFRAAGPDAVFEFFGHAFTAEQMTRHLDSELAIHRWDFMGTTRSASSCCPNRPSPVTRCFCSTRCPCSPRALESGRRHGFARNHHRVAHRR